MECGHWVCTNINCRPKRQSKWNQRLGRDEEVDLVCSLCRHVLEPGHEKMRLARIRFLRFPFCVGRPSEPPNCLDGRKRDPDSDGGGGCGNPYARASAPTNSVTSMRTSSSSSSSTRSSAPSVSSRSAKCSSDPKGFQATLHDTTSKEKLANSDDNTNAKETDDTTKMLGQCRIGRKVTTRTMLMLGRHGSE